LAEFLTTNAIAYYTEKIIKDAVKELYILFPYLQLSGEFYQAMKESSERDVQIILIYTNEDLQTEEKLKLSEISNLEIYKSENLNAKCCCSETEVLFSSMDPHQLSVSDSLEMGVLFNKSNDSDQFKKVYNEIKSLVSSSRNMNLHKRAVEELVQPPVTSKKIYHGFCMSCAMPISYNPEKPYCRSCAPKPDSPDAGLNNGLYCHLCGTIPEKEFNPPLCETCREEIA